MPNRKESKKKGGEITCSEGQSKFVEPSNGESQCIYPANQPEGGFEENAEVTTSEGQKYRILRKLEADPGANDTLINYTLYNGDYVKDTDGKPIQYTVSQNQLQRADNMIDQKQCGGRRKKRATKKNKKGGRKSAKKNKN